MCYRCDACGYYLNSEDSRTCDECQRQERAIRARRVQAAIRADGKQCEIDFIGGQNERDYVAG